MVTWLRGGSHNRVAVGAAAPGSRASAESASATLPSRTACHAMRPPLCLEHPQPTCSTSSAAFAGAAPAPLRPTASSRCRVFRSAAASGASGSGSACGFGTQPSLLRRPLSPQQTGAQRLDAAGFSASAATAAAGTAAADGAIYQRHWQRRGRRRLHVCAAGGPSKKLGGAVSSPRGSEVLPFRAEPPIAHRS